MARPTGRATMHKRSLVEVEKEISRLESSPMVALARKYEQVAYQRRKHMEDLQQLEQRGIALAEAGVTMDKIYSMADESYAVEDYDFQ